MIYLIIVSVIWALSFSLIKGNLTGIDSNLVAFIRLFFSFIIFLPFLKFKLLNIKSFSRFFLIGIVQYGFMYVTYIYSYKFLEAYQIAILTIFTPVFVVLIHDVWEKKIVSHHLLVAVLASIGAGIILFSSYNGIGLWKGILLMQISNLCFAFGQIYYKRVMTNEQYIKPHNIFSVLYLGAIFVTGIFSVFSVDFRSINISQNQWISLIYLGVVASGIGFFFWNIGATKVEAGTLAIMNNLKIPLAVLFAFLLLGESTDFLRLSIGTVVILAALIINEKYCYEN